MFDAPGLPPTRELPHRFPPTNLGQLYLGFNYLRSYPGEKHLIFMNERAIATPLDAIASAAAHAQATLSFVGTGGSISVMRQPTITQRRGTVTFLSRSFSDLDRELNVREAAERTGGQAFLYAHGHIALTAIERSSRFSYLVGYYPRVAWDGKYRNIKVRVKRDGVSVLHRRGYVADPDPVPISDTDVIAQDRLASAAESLRPPHDIAVAGSARRSTENGTSSVRVDLQIQMSRVTFTTDGNVKRASLDLVVYVGDTKQRLIGELAQRLDVKRASARPHGEVEPLLAQAATVLVKGVAKYVKVLVYDRTGDRLGATVLEVPR